MNVQFPNLQTAQNITFRNCPTISIPSLMNVTGSLGFYTNSLSTLSAVNLTSIGQSLAINTNSALTNISLPVLATIGGGFQVQNNTQLTNLTMPALTTIGGALDFYGGLSSVSLPALKDCRGGFNIQSSASNLDCSAFNAEHGSSSVIKGKYFCQANVTTPGNITTNPTTKKGSADQAFAGNAMLLVFSGALALVMATL